LSNLCPPAIYFGNLEIRANSQPAIRAPSIDSKSGDNFCYTNQSSNREIISQISKLSNSYGFLGYLASSLPFLKNSREKEAEKDKQRTILRRLPTLMGGSQTDIFGGESWSEEVFKELRQA
jgi:hypothetical protein